MEGAERTPAQELDPGVVRRLGPEAAAIARAVASAIHADLAEVVALYACDGAKCLAVVCAKGGLSDVQRLARSFKFEAGDTADDAAAAAFYSACRNGRLEVAKWLSAEYPFAAEYPIEATENVVRAATEACEGGHLAVLQWLVAAHPGAPPLETHDMCDGDDVPLLNACEYGQLEVAQWLVEQFGFGASVESADRTQRGAMLAACGHGHLRVAQWLAAEIGNVPDSDDDGGVFAETCCGGHLSVARWLAAELELTPESADEHALQYACGGGHLELVQWLVDSFGLDGARDRGRTALRYACESGHLELVQWLVRRFGLTAADARADDHRAFQEACAGGHLATAAWLFGQLGPNAEDDGAYAVRALSGACERGHLDVVQWLVRRFDLAAAEVRADYRRARDAPGSGSGASASVAAWLRERFGSELDG